MSSGKRLTLAFLWLALLSGGAAVYKYAVGTAPDQIYHDFDAEWDKALANFTDSPKIEDYVKKASGSAQAEVKAELDKRNHDYQVKHPRVKFAIDAFSGYCVFRSEEFRKRFKEKIKSDADQVSLHLVDDEADYKKRIKDFKSGDVKMGVFTIDALINNSVLVKDLPAKIVMMIDESKGADAVIGYKQAFPIPDDIDALNGPNVHFVLVPDSPSEMLVRVVKTTPKTSNLPSDYLVRAKDPDDVVKQFENQKKNPGDQRAFVLWEPNVSKLLKNHGADAQVLVDSKRFDGYIVDVFVVERNYLAAHRPVVQKVVEAYFEALAEYQKNKAMVELIRQDNNPPLETQEALKVYNGIAFKNASENYAHFDIEKKGLHTLDDMIRNITKVLKESNAIPSDPTNGDPKRLYDTGILEQLSGKTFKPDNQVVVKTAALTADQWKELQPVAKVKADAIEFLRGSDEVPESSDVPGEIAKTLKQWPHYYLEVRGYALRLGDADANKALAERRAKSVAKKIQELGIAPERLRAVGMDSGDSEEKAQVTFVMLQQP
jgi:outer membrane protein OmpA-like peptidoglycan-associated protein